MAQGDCGDVWFHFEARNEHQMTTDEERANMYRNGAVRFALKLTDDDLITLKSVPNAQGSGFEFG